MQENYGIAHKAQPLDKMLAGPLVHLEACLQALLEPHPLASRLEDGKSPQNAMSSRQTQPTTTGGNPFAPPKEGNWWLGSMQQREPLWAGFSLFGLQRAAVRLSARHV